MLGIKYVFHVVLNKKKEKKTRFESMDIPAPLVELENSAIISPSGILEPQDVDDGLSSISLM
jgi:hypothetical protein